MTQLALAWVARSPTTSTVILGATKPAQLLENLKAIEVVPKLTPDVLAKIDDILGNKPAPEVSHGRLLSAAPTPRAAQRCCCDGRGWDRLETRPTLTSMCFAADVGTPCPRRVWQAVTRDGAQYPTHRCTVEQNV